MPPPESKHPLTEAEKKLLDQWIMEGGKYDKHWSFNLPKSVDVPKSKHPSPQNEIDHFIAQWLEDSPLSPSLETDKKSPGFEESPMTLTGLPHPLKMWMLLLETHLKMPTKRWSIDYLIRMNMRSE